MGSRLPTPKGFFENPRLGALLDGGFCLVAVATVYTFTALTCQTGVD